MSSWWFVIHVTGPLSKLSTMTVNEKAIPCDGVMSEIWTQWEAHDRGGEDRWRGGGPCDLSPLAGRRKRGILGRTERKSIGLRSVDPPSKPESKQAGTGGSARGSARDRIKYKTGNKERQQRERHTAEVSVGVEAHHIPKRRRLCMGSWLRTVLGCCAPCATPSAQLDLQLVVVVGACTDENSSTESQQ